MKRIYQIFLFCLIFLILSNNYIVFANYYIDEPKDSIFQKDSSLNNVKYDYLKEASIVTSNHLNKGNIFQINSKDALSLSSIFGEVDILRHISTLPGVSQGVEGTLGLFVRGGNNTSNAIYLNDVPLYTTSHLFGTVSVLPANIIDNAKFYMGGVPSSKGNLSSSLLDINLIKEYGKKFNGKIDISPFLSGAYLSFPILKDKMSLRLSGRSFLSPYIMKKFFKKDFYKCHIYDLSLNLDYKISQKHTIEAFGFFTNDFVNEFSPSAEFLQQWNSRLMKLGWKYYINSKLSINSWLYSSYAFSGQSTSEYDVSSNSGEEIRTIKRNELLLNSSIKENAFNSRMLFKPNSLFSLDVGVSYQLKQIGTYNKFFVKQYGDITNDEVNNSSNLSFWGELNYIPFRWLDIRLGLRNTTIFFGNENNKKPLKSRVLNNVDIHCLWHIYFNKNFGAELSFDRMHQLYHSMEGLPLGWSLNLYFPVSKKFPSELNNQYYLGLFYSKKIDKLSFSSNLGLYYRQMYNLLAYINSSHAFTLKSLEIDNDIDIGTGTSYGLELSSEIKSKYLDLNLSYTLSKTDRKFTQINQGKSFPFKFDRRHILNMQAKVNVFSSRTKKGRLLKHSINTQVAYSSGNRVTLPRAYYEGALFPDWNISFSSLPASSNFYTQIYDRQLMSNKNEFKVKDYFRIDLSYNLLIKGKKVDNEFTISIYNVLNRHNPAMYFRRDGEWQEISIIPIMPSFRWSISW